jgi:hypothetical protein
MRRLRRNCASAGNPVDSERDYGKIAVIQISYPSKPSSLISLFAHLLENE